MPHHCSIIEASGPIAGTSRASAVSCASSASAVSSDSGASAVSSDSGASAVSCASGASAVSCDSGASAVSCASGASAVSCASGASAVSCASGASAPESKPRKRHRVIASSLANNSILAQSKKHRTAGSARTTVTTLNDSEYRAILSAMASKCSKNNNDGDDCLHRIALESKSTVAIEYLKSCREIMATKNKEEVKQYMHELFRSSITKTHYNSADGSIRKFDMDFAGLNLCKSCLSLCHNVSIDFIDVMSSELKKSSNQRVSVKTVKSYKDSTLSGFNYTQVESIFREHTGDDFADEEMIEAALIPLSNVQADCALWLKHYSKTYADHQPDSLCQLIAATHRISVYKTYKKECDNSTPPRESVQYSRFNALWHTILPFTLLRRQCGILGKCEICAEIDRLRKCHEDEVYHTLCKEAHTLHRGGLFFLERLA
jgi:hypothetical protein